MDLPEAKKNLAAFKRKATTAPGSGKKKPATKKPARAARPGIRVLEISALAGSGLEKLKLELHKALT
jgi:hypothetical protein